MSSFADTLKRSPRTPTADEEALQTPTIDPVFEMLMAASGGPAFAAKLAMQNMVGSGLSEIAGGREGAERYNKYMQYAVIPPEFATALRANLARGLFPTAARDFRAIRQAEEAGRTVPPFSIAKNRVAAFDALAHEPSDTATTAVTFPSIYGAIGFINQLKEHIKQDFGSSSEPESVMRDYQSK